MVKSQDRTHEVESYYPSASSNQKGNSLSVTTIAWIIGIALGIFAALFGLHRLGLFLEKRGLIYYTQKPSCGGGYNPLQELVQPNYRNVVEVSEQRHVDDDEGSPPEPGRD